MVCKHCTYNKIQHRTMVLTRNTLCSTMLTTREVGTSVNKEASHTILL